MNKIQSKTAAYYLGKLKPKERQATNMSIAQAQSIIVFLPEDRTEHKKINHWIWNLLQGQKIEVANALFYYDAKITKEHQRTRKKTREHDRT